MGKNCLPESYMIRYFLAIGLAISLMSCNGPKGIHRVWAIDDGEKIKQEDIENPLASDSHNAVWKNNRINIFGGKNEIVAFQLIIQADSSGVNNVNVEISDLTNGSSTIHGSSTGPADPFDYRGRNVEMFTEHYLRMTKRSPPLWFFSESAAPSSYYTGWVPDCLIPFSAPEGKGGAPFKIEGNRNQAVWIDILIPRSASVGTYTGNAIVTVSKKEFKKIPVVLKVYDFILSDSNHIQNMFGFDPGALSQRHGVAAGSQAYYDLEAKYFQMAHRHRFDLVTSVANLDAMTKYYKKYYTGEEYRSGEGYAGPGEGIGNGTFSIGYGGHVPDEYGKSVNTMTKSSWWTGSDVWEKWFIQNAPNVKRHKYLYPDEPDWKGPEGAKGTGSMDTIRMQARWSHNNPGIGKNIPTLVTNNIKPGLKGYVDFWSIPSEEFTLKITPEEIAIERALGHKFGIYNGYRPGMGAVVSDADAVEFRVMPWIVWKYNIDQYFYWSTTFWTDKNVFADPLTYEDRINGDGTFLYPGQDSLFPEENRNLDGPLSSIRAKNWRRGAQDFEYLWLAKKLGLEAELKTIVNNCVPTGLWEAKSQQGVTWSCHGYKFEEYREKLAMLLSSHSGKNN
jgi:hypothetical protein